jgi:6-phosphofructokinase 1
VLAEGLGSFLSADYLEGIKFDEHGHISLGQTNLARIMSKAVEKEYEKRTGMKRRLTGLQLGYEARCSLPLAFDVILGSQLGVGAYRALIEHRLDGVMVSCAGQLTLNYVPFETLVDPETLVTVVRQIPPGSDFHRLARFLEVYPPE